MGVKVSHYHADNGRFADNGFLGDVARNNQTISFCGVNAHFQNGRAEKRIRDLQEDARTVIIHTRQRWPRAIAAALWPYALRNCNDIRNSIKSRGKDASPLQLFSRSQALVKIKHFHPFGCPTHVLHSELASGKTLARWETRSRVGLYLGLSPRHARSVALVLNLETGHVSPQFHVRYDDLFETLKGGTVPKSQWQEKCYFTGASSAKQRKRKTIPPPPTGNNHTNPPVDDREDLHRTPSEPGDNDSAEAEIDMEPDEQQPVVQAEANAPSEPTLVTDTDAGAPTATTRSGP